MLDIKYAFDSLPLSCVREVYIFRSRDLYFSIQDCLKAGKFDFSKDTDEGKNWSLLDFHGYFELLMSEIFHTCTELQFRHVSKE